jgi:proton-translocating NADH-quinone oxidoreductase chain N
MKEFFLILPEIILTLTLVFIVIGEITYTGEQVRLITLSALLGLGAAFVQVLISFRIGTSFVFEKALIVDSFSLSFKLLFIALAIFTIFSSLQTSEISPSKRSEYIALTIACTLAMCFVASATNMIFGFMSLLFLSTSSCLLAAHGKRAILSTEAAVKYLAFGAVASTFLLYSLAILFNHTQSLNIFEMHQALSKQPMLEQPALVAFVLSFFALSFYIGSFPMYFLVPDLLEGSPTPVSAFLAVGTRTAGFAFAVRYLIAIFTQPGAVHGQWKVINYSDWIEIVAAVSGITMLVGSLLAMRQRSAKRLVGYLVVMESGFSLLGLVVLDDIGLTAMLYNFVVELLAFVGIYYILSIFYDRFQADKFDSLKGLLRRSLPECICFVLFLFCVVGSPPLPGFIGKFMLIGSVVRHDRLVLAGISIFSMVLSTITVARLAYHLVGDFRVSSFPREVFNRAHNYFLSALIIPLFLAGILADRIIRWAGESVSSIFW